MDETYKDRMNYTPMQAYEVSNSKKKNPNSKKNDASIRESNSKKLLRVLEFTIPILINTTLERYAIALYHRDRKSVV